MPVKLKLFSLGFEFQAGFLSVANEGKVHSGTTAFTLKYRSLRESQMATETECLFLL